jgi:signal transduction histidine kinase
VRDNGLGISRRSWIRYQPFFTTKPTGEATGLGLSLSYDMIKAHQGELKADSMEGEFASFTIELSYQ